MHTAVESQGGFRSPCKVASAGDRIVTALKSWNRELVLEIDPNLSKIVGPLTTAYVDCRQELADSAFSELASCSSSCKPLVSILIAINECVTTPWRQAMEVGESQYKALSSQWKTINPLTDIAALKEQLTGSLACFSHSENVSLCPTCSKTECSSCDD